MKVRYYYTTLLITAVYLHLQKAAAGGGDACTTTLKECDPLHPNARHGYLCLRTGYWLPLTRLGMGQYDSIVDHPELTSP